MNSYELSTYIEKYKREYEPIGHWLARKEFLLRNWADYPERQVVCLSMVWSNMEYDGSTYSPELTERVQSLACRLDTHNSGLILPKCTESTDHQPTNEDTTQQPNNTVRILPSKYNIKFQRQGSLEEVTSVSQKVDVPVDKCELQNELPEALKLFITKLKSWSINTQHPNVVEEVCTCASKLGINLDFDFTERSYSVLMNKLKANRKKTKVKLHPIWVCSLYIGDLLICSAEDFNKVQAKRDCFADAISRLVKPGLYTKVVNCASLENGRRHTSEICVDETFGSEIAIEKTQKVNTSHHGNEEISVNIETDEHNSTKITSGIGMEILKKMGWSGEGGLGKNEQGRAEPVLVEQRGNRKGFGFPFNKQTEKRLTKKKRGYGQTLMATHTCVSKKGKELQKQQSNVCVSEPVATLGSDVGSRCIKDQPLELSQIKTHVKTINSTISFGDFIIFETDSSINNPIQTLMSSGRQNKVNILFEISNIPVKYKDKMGYMGTLTIGGKVITRVVNDDQKAVKRSVAEAALKELRTYCHTIRVRSSQPDSVQNRAVNLAFIKTFDHKSPLFDKQTVKETRLYKEDGLGTSGTMVEPVFEEIDNHEDFHGTDVGPPTEKAFIEMLRNFAAGDQEDLVLSSELTSEQRKVLHNSCGKFNLKSTSYGKCAERYIVISRKRGAQELAQYIAKNGDSTLRYTLIPPHKD